MSLTSLLSQIPGLYEDLEDAALPVRTGEPSDWSKDPREKPAPGRLGVIDHRHKLVRSLRWWVDALRSSADDSQTRVGHDVSAMCDWLQANQGLLVAEDRGELRATLAEWCAWSWRLVDPAPPAKGEVWLPPEAAEQLVPQKTAAELLGCPVSTVWRRNGKRGGPVRVVDVLDAERDRCIHDLWRRTCAICTPPVA